jgi:hypothetical protein
MRVLRSRRVYVAEKLPEAVLEEEERRRRRRRRRKTILELGTLLPKSHPSCAEVVPTGSPVRFLQVCFCIPQRDSPPKM